MYDIKEILKLFNEADEDIKTLVLQILESSQQNPESPLEHPQKE